MGVEVHATIQKRIYNADIIRIKSPQISKSGHISSGVITDLDDGTISDVIDGNLGSYIRSLNNTGIYCVLDLKTDGNLNIESGMITELIK